MKKTYIKPHIEPLYIEIETLLANSKQDEYAIGRSGSKWPKSGEISDDYGAGPGVSGTRQGGINAGNLWEN